jgi:hypothetical protein
MADPSLAAMASQLESFAANEIQRCYRGHKVRQQVAYFPGTYCPLLLGYASSIRLP